MERKYDIYCVGFKRVFYPGTVAGDSAFEYESAECSKDILCCYIDNEYKTKFEIELETHYDWCGSGYCGATYGSMERYEVQEFGPLTHITKEHTPVKIEGAFYEQVSTENRIKSDYIFNNYYEDDDEAYYFNNEEIHNNVFYYDPDGGDSYYPMGGAGVNEDLFEELPRAFNRRPVWIFYGESATGKSTLAYLLKDKEVYETDSAENGVLPDELWYDVIVIGNKWPKITIDDVLKKIVDSPEIILVDFNKKEV